jgi:type II secretion system protein I
VIDSRRSLGFTLIEVVVAIAIFAVCIGPILAAFGGAERRIGQVRRHERALLVAQSMIARVRATEDFSERVKMGNDAGGLRWRVESTPEQTRSGVEGPLRVYRVQVSIFDGDSLAPTVVLKSIELGRADL